MSDVSLASGGKKPSTTSVLVQCMMEEFDVPIEPVQRKYWNETAGRFTGSTYCSEWLMAPGLDFITQLIVEGDERAGTIVAASTK